MPKEKVFPFDINRNVRVKIGAIDTGSAVANGWGEGMVRKSACSAARYVSHEGMFRKSVACN